MSERLSLVVGRALHAFGIALFTFVTGIGVYQKFSELSLDTIYQPLVQAVLMALTALGIGPAVAAMTRRRSGPRGKPPLIR